MFDQTEDGPRQLVRSGRNAFRCAQSGFHASIEAAQSALAALQRTGGNAQSIGDPVNHAPRFAAEHFAAANAVVRT